MTFFSKGDKISKAGSSCYLFIYFLQLICCGTVIGRGEYHVVCGISGKGRATLADGRFPNGEGGPWGCFGVHIGCLMLMHQQLVFSVRGRCRLLEGCGCARLPDTMKKPMVSHLWLCSCSLVHLLSACVGWGLVNRFEIQGIGKVLKLFSTFAILILRNNNTYHEHQDILKCAPLTGVSRQVRLDFSVDVQWKMRCLCVPCYPYAIVFLPHVKKNSVRSCWRLVEPLHLVPWGTKMWEKQ